MTVMVMAISGCGGKKTVMTLEEAGAMTEEQLGKELSGFGREKIIAAWGEPDQPLFGMNGEIYDLDGERTVIVYYDGSDSEKVELVKFGEISHEFEGTIKEIYGTGAVVQVDEGFPIRSSGDQVSIALDDSIGEVQVGDRVRVIYSGPVMESYPLQLENQVSVELLD